MLRREFLQLAGSAALFSLTSNAASAAAGHPQASNGASRTEGANMGPPKAHVFVDDRLISPGDLAWLSPEGKSLPVAGPPDPPVEAYADWSSVPRGIRLVAQPATKTDPLAAEGAPFGRVIMEDGIYRSWTLDVNYPPGRDLGAYSTDIPREVSVVASESSDGFEWRERGRCPVSLPGQTCLDGFTFFVDPHGAGDERYKAVYMAAPPASEVAGLWERYRQVHPRHRDVRLSGERITCIYGLVSPDGLRWQPIAEPLLTHKSDTDTTVYFDEALGKYVMYTRLYWLDRRMIARAETDDFRHWEPVSPLIWASLEDPLSTDVYTNGRTIYPGMPDVHLMFPMFYHRSDQTSDIRLFASRDGINWNRVPGRPVIRPGDPGEWDGEFIVAGKDLVPLGSERVGIPYSGIPYPHKYPRWKQVLASGRRAWAWWPKGRLCAVTADDEGEFCTFPVTVAGAELRLNARVRRAGGIWVELIGRDGRSLQDCDVISGDSLAHPVHWRGQAQVGVDPGTAVQLRFRLRHAELFGFEWV